jgi:hypothetical protein
MASGGRGRCCTLTCHKALCWASQHEAAAGWEAARARFYCDAHRVRILRERRGNTAYKDGHGSVPG